MAEYNRAGAPADESRLPSRVAAADASLGKNVAMEVLARRVKANYDVHRQLKPVAICRRIAAT
jgi:hypothetical protein